MAGKDQASHEDRRENRREDGRLSGYYGLIELVLVFGIVLGLGVWQLYSVRRDAHRAGDAGVKTSSAVRRKSDGIEH